MITQATRNKSEPLLCTLSAVAVVEAIFSFAPRDIGIYSSESYVPSGLQWKSIRLSGNVSSNGPIITLSNMETSSRQKNVRE